MALPVRAHDLVPQATKALTRVNKARQTAKAVSEAMSTGAQAQGVTPRLTGASVLGHLGNVRQAVLAHTSAAHDNDARKVADKLQQMGDSLAQALGSETDKPLSLVDDDARARAMRTEAAMLRVTAWLKVSTSACAPGERHAMVAALMTTLDRLAHDGASQDSPLPIIDGVQTLDHRALFVFGSGMTGVPRFVLTGTSLVDAQCASPEVVAVNAHGEAVAVQPQLVAAQPSRIEMQWPGVGSLPPGSYVLEVTAHRERMLFGCSDQPVAVAAVQVMPASTYAVGYAVKAECAGHTAPVTLDAGTLSVAAGKGKGAVTSVDMAKCSSPGSFIITGSIRTPSGQLVSTYGPIAHGAGVTVTQGLGHGLVLHWNPFQHQLLVSAGSHTCKGVY